MSERNKWFVPQHLDAPRRIGFFTVPEAAVGFAALMLVNETTSLAWGIAAGLTAAFGFRAFRHRLSGGPGLRPLCYWYLAIGCGALPPSWKRLLRG